MSVLSSGGSRLSRLTPSPLTSSGCQSTRPLANSPLTTSPLTNSPHHKLAPSQTRPITNSPLTKSPTEKLATWQTHPPASWRHWSGLPTVGSLTFWCAVVNCLYSCLFFVFCRAIDVLTPRSSLMRIIQHKQHKKFAHKLAIALRNCFSKRQLRCWSACIFSVQPMKTLPCTK